MALQFNLPQGEHWQMGNISAPVFGAATPEQFLGRLTIKSVAVDGSGECLNITYVPTLLPKGVSASADPLLPARAAPYAIGLGKRLGEGAKQ